MDATFRRAPDRNRRTVIGPPVRLLLLLAAPLLLAADAPSTQPSAQMREWFEQLNDPKPEVREQAAERLMSQPPDQLPALRNLVQESLPITPSQRVALREIVNQLFLAGEPYEADPAGGGFLGLYWPHSMMTDDTTPGILVMRRVPGFPSYAALRDGDIIVSIREIPVPVPTLKVQFGDMVGKFQPGATLTLQVVRNGRQTVASVTLKARPAGVAGEMRREAWINSRRDAADEYWNKTFRPLVGGDQML